MFEVGDVVQVVDKRSKMAGRVGVIDEFLWFPKEREIDFGYNVNFDGDIVLCQPYELALYQKGGQNVS